MSGGSWNYLYDRVHDAAIRLRESSNPRRYAMSQHVERLAVALRAIEWVDSCDYGPGDDNAAIDAFLAGFGDARMQAESAASRKIAEQIKSLEVSDE